MLYYSNGLLHIYAYIVKKYLSFKTNDLCTCVKLQHKALK